MRSEESFPACTRKQETQVSVCLLCGPTPCVGRDLVVWGAPQCGAVPCGSVPCGSFPLPVFPSFHVASTRLMSLARTPAPAL